MEKQPSFFIVGAMKAGTSNLRSLLHQHPQVFLSIETGYFGTKSAKKGLDWYLEHFKEAKPGQVQGDKSPNYYFYRNVAKEMHAFNPKAKLIWILREPISRAYSDYWFSIYRGKDYKSFEEAVELEFLGKRKENRHYLFRSDYSTFIKRFLKYFPVEQMLFIKLDDLYNDPVMTARQCFSFLAVDETFAVKQEEKLQNPTHLPRSFYLNYLNSKLFANNYPVLRFRIRALLKRKTPGYPKLDPAMKTRLKDHFRPQITELEKLTGLTFPEWK